MPPRRSVLFTQRGRKERILTERNLPAPTRQARADTVLHSGSSRRTEQRLPPPAKIEREPSNQASPPDALTAAYTTALNNLAKPTLIGVFGTPSALTYWGLHCLRTIMQTVYGDYYFLPGVYVEDLRQAWSQRGKRSVMVVSESPESPLLDLIINSGAPIFVFADDPLDVIDDIISSFGGDAYNALRLTSRCFSTLNDLFHTPAAFYLGREDYDRDVRTFVKDVLRVFGDIATDVHIERVMQRLIIDPFAAKGSTIGEQVFLHFPYIEKRGSIHSLPTAEPIERVVRCYDVIANRQTLHEIEWPREIFLSADYGSQPVTGHQELAGPARFFIYGPYMHLPAGHWVARVEIEVSENYSGNRLQADVVSGEILSAISADLPENGVFAFQLQFETSEPLLPIEVRFQLQSGAIEGQFLLRCVTIRRTPRRLSRREGAGRSQFKTD